MSVQHKPNNGIEKISIITPCYQASAYIDKTYESIKAQSYPHWEWVVVDDCSTDNSFEKLTNIAKHDPRVKIFRNEKNLGAAVTRNLCIDKANGEYVAFLDCDDLWMIEKLELQLSFMQKNNLSFSYHDYELIDGNNRFVKYQKVNPIVYGKDLLKFNPFATSSIMVKRQSLIKNGIRFKEHLRRRQDYLFWYDSVVKLGPVKGLGETLSSYRVFADRSLSANKAKMAKIQWDLYRNEFGLSLLHSFYYYLHYAWHGIKKYFIK